MLTVRVIPRLDVKAGRVVNGVKFQDHRDAGDPVELVPRLGRQPSGHRDMSKPGEEGNLCRTSTSRPLTRSGA